MKRVSLNAVEYICINMREVDQREIYNMRNHDSPLVLAREVCMAASIGKAGVAWRDNKPAAVVGVSPLWPGVWSIWSFGTEDWTKCALEITKYGQRVLKPWLYTKTTAHRLQCESRVDHKEAHEWLVRCGAHVEGRLSGYGRDGSDYIMFAWRRE